jgi:hypothetical protein
MDQNQLRKHRQQQAALIRIPLRDVRAAVMTRLHLTNFQKRRAEAKAQRKWEQVQLVLSQPLPDSLISSESRMAWVANQLSQLTELSPDSQVLILVPEMNAQIPLTLAKLQALATHYLISTHSQPASHPSGTRVLN